MRLQPDTVNLTATTRTETPANLLQCQINLTIRVHAGWRYGGLGRWIIRRRSYTYRPTDISLCWSMNMIIRPHWTWHGNFSQWCLVWKGTRLCQWLIFTRCSSRATNSTESGVFFLSTFIYKVDTLHSSNWLLLELTFIDQWLYSREPTGILPVVAMIENEHAATLS